MTNPLAGQWAPPTVHSTRNEGIRLGLIVGTVTWLWVALMDAATGRPWHTFSTLGGVLPFTVVHYLLSLVYGTVLVFAVHAAERAPSVIFAMIFGGIILQDAFLMFTIILATSSVGSVAWAGIAGGSLIGAAVAVALLARRHPLARYFRRAEEER